MDVKNSPSNGNLHSSSETWWLDKANQNRPFHSQWLQNNMSELDKKMEDILKVVEEGGDTFAERAEMYYQKRPQLIHMLQELHASYRDLASKYDILVSRSDSTVSRVCSGTTLGLDQPDLHHSHQSETWADVYSIINNQGHLINNNNNCTTKHVTTTVESGREKETERSPFEDKNNSGLDLDQGEEKSHEGEKEELEEEMEYDEKWNSLKIEVSKLMEDNLSYQNELIKRNDEKRDSIKRLMHENKLLKDSLHHKGRRGGEKMQARPPSCSSSSYSKLKKSIFGVFSC